MVSFKSLLALAPFAQYVLAQTTPYVHEDPDTGIVFSAWRTAQMSFGFAFPEDAQETDADEFIGYLACATPGGEGAGWCGLSLGGSMRFQLLLAAYPHEEDVFASLYFADDYVMPDPYTGDAQITQISSSINSTHFEVLYRCEGCLSWSQNGFSGSLATSSGGGVLGWCHGRQPATDGECPETVEFTQHELQGIFGGAFNEAAFDERYDEWTDLATNVVEGDCDDTPPTTSTATETATSTSVPATPAPTDTYDYVVVGAGAGGIPIADRLSEAGHSVLLIEKGPPSSGRWGGDEIPAWQPDWLDDTNLTRFDVPGLCNQIWADSRGIACQDTDQMAGCVLGGGTAINAGLWWRPYSADWDYNFPEGWQADDMADATERVFSRIPGTITPSQDGVRYLDEGFQVIADGLSAAGWSGVNALEDPEAKNYTYSHSPFMFEGGERGGPLATYLVSANARDNFEYWTNTQVRRLIREGGHVTGLEVLPYNGAGYVGTVNLTPRTGRVILAAGTFGSARLLLRSGIGPQDQLEIVQRSTADGDTMIDEEEWINLPVGYNLEDHTNTDTVVTHPDVVFYDFYEAYNNPPPEDAEKYLEERAGILAQAAPNIGPVFFEEIEGADGIVRQMQWTARIEPSLGLDNYTAITMSQYLGRGATSRGRMTLDGSLNTVVSDAPYLKDQEDVEAVITSLEHVVASLQDVEGLTWEFPAEGQSAREYVEEMQVSWSNRRANHWIGTNKLGADDGREDDGTAVVDLDTKVYGTNNLFVVDASIFPGMVTTNPSAYIIVASERASERILALEPPQAQGPYEQCGGLEWTGNTWCDDSHTCTELNPYYHQCYPNSS